MQDLAPPNHGWAVQTAFQGWRAVVLHMAARREQLQQAALASAERAIQRGCHAASGSTVLSRAHTGDVTTARPLQLRGVLGHHSSRLGHLAEHPGSLQGHQSGCCSPVEQQREHSVPHIDGCVQSDTTEASGVGIAAATAHEAAVELTAAFFKAAAHWLEKLQARVLHAWQDLSRQAIAAVWQQHERKAAANQELLQVTQLTADHFPVHAVPAVDAQVVLAIPRNEGKCYNVQCSCGPERKLGASRSSYIHVLYIQEQQSQKYLTHTTSHLVFVYCCCPCTVQGGSISKNALFVDTPSI